MAIVKIFLTALISFSVGNAYAEYDETYCGTFKRVKDLPGFTQYTSINFNYVIDMTETCSSTEVTYAGVYAYGDEVGEIENIIETSRPSTIWCVKGRWSGMDPCVFESGEDSVSTRTESIDRIDRQSAFD